MPRPGVYFAFGDPLVLGVQTYPQLVDIYQSIQDSVRDILTTQVGTRRMRPRYGMNIMSFLFETNNDYLIARAQVETRRALEVNEPRIAVVRVDVESRQDETGNPTIIVITPNYTISGAYLTQTITFQRQGG